MFHLKVVSCFCNDTISFGYLFSIYLRFKEQITMQRSITGLEQSIKSVDSKLDRIEWKIETISTGTMGVGEGAEFSLLKLLTSVADVKKQFEKEKESLDALKSEHENISASLYDTIATLQNRYMNLYYKLNQDDS